MKIHGLILPLLLSLALISATASSKAADIIVLVPTDKHHVAELNSDQSFVAGYQVNTHDLVTLESLNATAVTVTFPSTEPSYFPLDTWLGTGMFVQAQDYKLYNVDYAFYTMLVLDSSGSLFLDYGTHQTRESTSPLQSPTSDLLYAHTWQIEGIDPSTLVTLTAAWQQEGFVNYSILTSGHNITLPPINVASLPGCETIIRRFFAGTYNAGVAFPLGHYVHYFQFGVICPDIIGNNHWSASLKNPMILRRSGWQIVDTAWSTQGDISYIDYDWKWGGKPYQGVSAQCQVDEQEDSYELLFFYNGQTLQPGTVLWQNASAVQKQASNVPSALFGRPFTLESAFVVLAEAAVFIGITVSIFRLKRKQTISQV